MPNLLPVILKPKQNEFKSDAIFVHDGKYITSSGGAKSFEVALYLCEYLCDKEIAQSLAPGLVIDWNFENIPHTIIAK
jgi:transcriptional regulator GlxA family with amidase domain